jgi:hypothetical protein
MSAGAHPYGQVRNMFKAGWSMCLCPNTVSLQRDTVLWLVSGPHLFRLQNVAGCGFPMLLSEKKSEACDIVHICKLTLFTN